MKERDPTSAPLEERNVKRAPLEERGATPSTMNDLNTVRAGVGGRAVTPAAAVGAHRRKRAHIAHDVRRQVAQRDGDCCSYIGRDGKRCAARAFLQFHHEKAWARGGADSVENLRVLCRAHNRLLAEQELGAEVVQRAIERRSS